MLKTVYEIDWNGWESNSFAAACSIAMVLGMLFASRSIVRAVMTSLKGNSKKGGWRSAVFIVFFWLSLILLVAGSGRSSAYGSGVTEGVSRSGERGAKKKLAISILYILILPWVFVSVILREDPLKLSVTSDSVGLIYRLPWRNQTIPFADISGVKLERHTIQERFGPDYFYVLTIEHNGMTTSVHCNHRTWYESQLVSAYHAIQNELLKKKQQHAATTMISLPNWKTKFGDKMGTISAREVKGVGSL